MVVRVLHLAVATSHALALVAGIETARPHERFAIVNGGDYVIVGRRMFEDYVRTKSCMRIETKRYGGKLVVHLCYI